MRIDSWDNWDEDNYAEKAVDKSTFNSNGTVIPKRKWDLFGSDKVAYGRSKRVVLIYNNHEYSARIEVTKNKSRRLFWQSDFADLLKNFFIDEYNVLANCSTNGRFLKNSIIRFNKLSEQKYHIELKKESYINIKIADFSPLPEHIQEEKPPINFRRNRLNKRRFRARKWDVFLNDLLKKRIGTEGELIALRIEKEFLIKNGRPDLADDVRHVSRLDGDGLGYDIKSFFLDGREKFVEVKATSGGKNTPFLMSENELAFMKENRDNYSLIRIYDYDKQSGSFKYYRLEERILEKFVLKPTQYRVFLKDENC